MAARQFCFWLFSPDCTIDMQSTAAWLQAIGAIVGLGVTIYLYRNQIEQNRLEKNQAREDRRKSQILLIRQFADLAESLMNKCIEFEAQLERSPIHYENLRNFGFRIEDCVVWSRLFQIDSLNAEELESFVAIRGSLHALSTWIMRADYGDMLTNREYIPNLYQGVHDDIIRLTGIA